VQFFDFRVIAMAALVMSSGCLLAGNYHSARTLEKGTSSVGLNFSTTTYSLDEADGTTDRVTIPNLVPELTYHVGIEDDLEVGGRVALGALALEADVKYRFFQSPDETLHLAIAPAAFVQSFIIINGVGGRVPIVGTADLSDNISFTAAAFGSVTSYSSPSV
jgi:hypothetical protein